MALATLLDQADSSRLEDLVRELEGPRHPQAAPERLVAAENLIAHELDRAGLSTERRPFEFRGRSYHNVVGTLPGSDPKSPRTLVGAHFDTVRGSPGADDNASGVAVMLEVARLAAKLPLRRHLEFVGFNLEEPQDALGTYRVGSSRFAAQARRDGRRYAGALILEMVGYVDDTAGAQQVPPLVFRQVPDTGTFLAAVGDGRSRKLLHDFESAAARHVPDLAVIAYRAWLRGWLLPLTRLSDNASFWDQRYPALMVTDTAFLRNPHYHMGSDAADTLDYDFMRKVTQTVLAVIAARDRE